MRLPIPSTRSATRLQRLLQMAVVDDQATGHGRLRDDWHASGSSYFMRSVIRRLLPTRRDLRFTQVSLEQLIRSRQCCWRRGRGVPAQYKTSMTWADGWRAGMIGFYVGARAAKRPAFLLMRRFSVRGASFEAWVRQTMWMCVEVVGR